MSPKASLSSSCSHYRVEGQPEGSKISRMSINKSITGDLVATSVGQMLSAMTEVKGSAGYVAIETVAGVLDGKQGSFVLQHTGTMNKGTPSLSVTVVPDSGTGELLGLAGEFNTHHRWREAQLRVQVHACVTCPDEGGAADQVRLAVRS